MPTYTLQAKTRDLLGRKTNRLRAEGMVPAVVYGPALSEPKNILIERGAFTRLFKEAGESSIVELALEKGEPLHVLIQDIQQDPLRDEVIHADFRAVDMTKKVETEVKLRFVGESAAVKSLGGTLVHPIEAIKVRALPKDLVNHIDIDISKLTTFDDVIQVKDIAAPAGIELLLGASQTVALVAPPRSEEEMAELDKAVDIDVSKVEVAAKKKEEPEEGAEAPSEAAPKAEAPAKGGKPANNTKK